MTRLNFLILLVACVLAACSSGMMRAEFDKSLDKYNELVRWRELDKAALFASNDISGKFRARVEAAKDARVIDYQVVDVRYDEKTKRALATISYKYYSLSTGLVHDMTDTQEWIYTTEDNAKGWRLNSPLPEFR